MELDVGGYPAGDVADRLAGAAVGYRVVLRDGIVLHSIVDFEQLGQRHRAVLVD